MRACLPGWVPLPLAKWKPGLDPDVSDWEGWPNPFHWGCDVPRIGGKGSIMPCWMHSWSPSAFQANVQHRHREAFSALGPCYLLGVQQHRRPGQLCRDCLPQGHLEENGLL